MRCPTTPERLPSSERRATTREPRYPDTGHRTPRLGRRPAAPRPPPAGRAGRPLARLSALQTAAVRPRQPRAKLVRLSTSVRKKRKFDAKGSPNGGETCRLAGYVLNTPSRSARK